MSIPFKKYGYELNPITNEYRQPKIYLVDKRIHKIGELYPIEELKITVNGINQADEISFCYRREAGGEESPFFDKLDDLSVVLVEDYGYFEISIEKDESSSITKSVTGISLGHAELSQTLTTLEINTEDDTNRDDHDEGLQTVFYRSLDTITDAETERKYRDSSLLHRVLSRVPHYQIGTVSKTLWQIQRTFSWSDTDILSILNDIAKEIHCAFDIQIYLEDGKAKRVIHVHDLQYCDKCYNEWEDSQKISSHTYKFRTIIDGKCQNCGSSEDVVDIGTDTNIFISTENLSDEISIRGDKDSIKNCFKVTGGDDMITAAVQGLNMSASDRIMIFSEKQKQEMSPELRDGLESYDEEYQGSIGEYESLLETEYNIYDIKHYLQSSKMPPLEKEILSADMALYTVIQKVQEYYKDAFYISSYENYKKYGYSSARTSIQNMFTTFMPEGYSFMIDYDDMTRKTDSYDPGTEYHWYGRIHIYSTGKRDEGYTLHIQPDKLTYVTQGDENEAFEFSDPSMQSLIRDFSIRFYFADQSQTEYKSYIEQHTKYILSTVDLTYENEKQHPWDLYSYNRLKSFHDGYQSCIDTLEGMRREEICDSETDEILTDMISSYQSIQKDILSQMNVLMDQLFAISCYHGVYDSDFLDAEGNVTYMFQHYSDIQTIYAHMIDPEYVGGYEDGIYRVNEFIGTKPFRCKKCGSSNVAVSTNGNVCRNHDCKSSGDDIYTYQDIMQNIYDSYCSHKGDTIANMREIYQKKFRLMNYLGAGLYAELCSFIREDVYKNDNYISDGLNNTQLLEHAKELRARAEQELAKACMVQYTVDVPLSSIVGQKSFLYHGVPVNDEYSGFRINNFVRVRIDGEIYRMRIASMRLSFPVTDKIEVTFTNVTNYSGETLSDVKDILDKASRMATSYSYVATQAEKGDAASIQIDTLKKEGLDAALMAVKAGQDQDIIIDSHGILLRRKSQETDSYSQYQMKLIDRNLVMTADYWETAKLAIGLGMYNGKPVYGVWADLLVGDMIVGKEMVIKNDEDDKKSSVRIDGDGIQITSGKIDMHNATSGIRVNIDPGKENVFEISKGEEIILGFNEEGDAFFEGKVNATGIFGGKVNADSGKFGDAEIKNNTNIYIPDLYDLSNFNPVKEITSTVLTNCVITSSDYGMYEDETDDDMDEDNVGEYLHGNILDLEHDYLQIGDTRICNKGIAHSMLYNENNIHTSNHGTSYWELNNHGLSYYAKEKRASRGNLIYYYNDASIQFIPGSSPGNVGNDDYCYHMAKSNAKILYSTEGYHEFAGLYVQLPEVRCGGTIYNRDSDAVVSDINKENSIEDPDERYISLFDNIELKRFKYNDGASDRYHLGVIAQSVEEGMDQADLSVEEFAGLVIDGQGHYFVRYDEINMLTALKVKKMEQDYKNMAEYFNNQIANLKNRINTI